MSSSSTTIFCCAKAKLDFLTPVTDEALYKYLIKATVSDLAKLITPVPTFTAAGNNNGLSQVNQVTQNVKIERWDGDKKAETLGYFRYLVALETFRTLTK
jgi:hypothetical protein